MSGISKSKPNGCQCRILGVCDVPENILDLTDEGCLELTAEAIMEANPPVVTILVDNDDGTFTYTNEEGTEFIIDACKLIADGGCLPSITPGATPFEYIFDNGYGETSTININEVDFDVNSVTIAGSVLTFTSENGNEVTADLCAILAANCDDQLVYNGDGSWTHTAINQLIMNIYSTGDEADNVATIGENGGTYVTCEGVLGCWNGEFSDSIFPEDGDPVSGSGSPADPFIFPIEHITDLVDNGDGSFTYNAEDGTPYTWAETPMVVTTDGDALGVTQSGNSDHIVDIIVTSGDVTNIATIGPDGGTLVTCEGATDCIAIEFSDSVTYVDGDAPNGAGTVADPFILPIPVVTTLVDNGDGTYTYTSEDGTVTIIDIRDDTDTNYSLVDNGDGTFSLVGTDGSDQQIDLCGIIGTFCTDSLELTAPNTWTHTALDGQVTVITVPDETLTLLIDNRDGTFTYTNESGTPIEIDACDLLAEGGCTDEFIDNGDGTFTHNALDGTSVTFALPEYAYVAYDPALHTFGIVEGDGSAPDPHQFPITAELECTDVEDCINFEYVTFDGAVHVDGSPAAGDGSPGAPYQIPLAPPPDICDVLAAVPAGTCDPDASIVTSDCELIPIANIQPRHVFESCVGTGVALDDAGLAGPPAEPTAVNSMSLIETGQFGTYVGGNGAPGDRFGNDTIPDPLTIPIPATTGTSLYLHLVWNDTLGGLNAESGAGDVASLTMTGTDVSAPALLDARTTWPGTAPRGTHHQLHGFDALTGAAGSSLSVTFPNGTGPTPYDSVFTWYWYEVDGVAVGDLGTPVIVETGTTDFQAVRPSGSGATPTSSNEFDLGECDALMFGFGRHTAYPATESNDIIASDWATINSPNYTEVGDFSSGSSATVDNLCQLGETAGWLAGNAGPNTVDWVMNDPGFTIFTSQAPNFVFLPIADCSTPTGGGGMAVISVEDPCVVNITNPDCNPPAVAKVRIQGKACVTAQPGSELGVRPVINGNTLPEFSVGNAAGNTEEKSICAPIVGEYVLPATVAPGSAAPVITAGFEVVVTDTNGTGNAVDVSDYQVTVELCHI